MRYADHAYAHAVNHTEDKHRAEALDRRAEAAGQSNTADHIDEVQGRPDTRSFEGERGRTCWANQEAGLYGWNNSEQPEASTAVAARNPTKDFERQKQNFADSQSIDKGQVQEKGPISEQDRQAPDRGPDRGGSQGSGSQSGTPEQGAKAQDAQAAAQDAEKTAQAEEKIERPPAPPAPPQAETQSDIPSNDRSR